MEILNPLIIGFPIKTFGSEIVYSCQFIPQRTILRKGQNCESFSFKKLTNLFLRQYETLVERIIHYYSRPYYLQ
jgi:hypothetical protein